MNNGAGAIKYAQAEARPIFQAERFFAATIGA
jgi:hypothetical protein